MKVAYVLKRYPRYSETFIVNEILAHEAANLDVEIFSLRLPEEASFQAEVSRVRSRLTYLAARRARLSEFWGKISEASETIPDIFAKLELAKTARPELVLQAAWLAREARLRGITHLHAHFGTEATAVARLASHFAEIPYTFTAHAKDIFHEYVVREELEKRLSDAANVVTVSDFNVGFLRSEYGEAASNVRRIYNGLDLEKFPYSEPRDRPPRIVAVGRIVEKKGFPVLVEACRILADRGRSFECRIIGGGLLEAELEARIHALGLEGTVEMTGPLPQSVVKDEIKNAAAFAAPCIMSGDGDRDGLPTVLLEAMALGTPCVSTDVTGIPEVVRDGETGLMVRQNDPAALAAALERTVDDADLRVHLAENARAVIEEDFDVKRNAAKLREVFTASSFDASSVEGASVRGVAS